MRRKNFLFGSLVAGSVIFTSILFNLAVNQATQLFSKPSDTKQISLLSSEVIPPPPEREFRGVWVATVINIDWPSKAGLTSQQQQAELIEILDRAAELNLNAVVFQVRPAADALYDSPYEPWSESLTGEMGKAPTPYYDPLAFAVEEAHKRGLELHAWFNPYRAYHEKATSPISANHISQTRPHLVKEHGKYLWLDPGEPEVQDYSIKVIMDVVRRYDIDGVHLDDYFYPYGADRYFPDEESWQKYLESGGTLTKDDWRRENNNMFVQRLYEGIKAVKPWVKFGISPFGIWRPGNPEQIKGLDAYQQLYADSRKWLANGWVDYFAPQLYWKIDQPEQSYPVLLSWWSEQNIQDRHLWVGNYTGRVSNTSELGWQAEEIIAQIEETRKELGATGNIHFSMKSLLENRGEITTKLANEVYANPALVPASPWLENRLPAQPIVAAEGEFQAPLVCPNSSSSPSIEWGREIPPACETEAGVVVRPDRREKIKLTWRSSEEEDVWLWVVQMKKGQQWTTEILPRIETAYLIDSDASIVAVSAVNRYGTQGKAAVVEINDN
ncbi:glycoside hydrolase family 10 protein [Oscillatoria salina]|uniref:glycoside hydrolase family 10 protein n=1 Tax=Oscillatoria salina TaxID=331517 RepID=UPI0013BE810B|nr:family 10 glycosylhydrolase [Oscillatoria salina]MBZ8178514.1 family 10 glycosylhydrolase [Oscillatoria salina IIICB1]NET86878.1 family 10 glycosylhydrolase [Kamptonema sp. SIO1D9]